MERPGMSYMRHPVLFTAEAAKEINMAKNQLTKEASEDNQVYNKAIRKPVNDKAFLLEAGQGRNVNGNVFALLRYIRGCSRFDGYRVMLSLVPEKRQEAEAKLKKYGIGNVDFVDFGGQDYRRALGTAKYLITDNSFPAYFYKRPEQVYLNTWHGTPLKALGRTDLDNAVSIGNVQANMAKADWLLHPNSFTKNIMMGDYMMERVFRHKTVVMDYPRNDALYREEFRGEITQRYGLEGKKIYAYMPTWRGVGRDADEDAQLEHTRELLREMDELLREDEILFVNLHFLISKGIDYSGFSKVRTFPSEYETYDFLSVCDTLITDYSSVSIDFAGTGKEVVLYLYDYEEYKREKGFYLDVKELPFKKAATMQELDEALHSERVEYELDASLISADRRNSSERLIKLICGEADEAGYDIEDYGARDDAPVIAYFDNINREDIRDILDSIQQIPAQGGKGRPVIMFPTSMTEETIATLRTLDKDTDFVRISGRFYCSNEEFWLLDQFRRRGLFRKKAEAIYDREANRQIRQFRMSSLEVKQCKNADRLNMLERV